MRFFITCFLSLLNLFALSQKDTTRLWVNLMVETHDMDSWQPSKNIEIQLLRDDGKSYAGRTDANGRFRLNSSNFFFIPGHNYTLTIDCANTRGYFPDALNRETKTRHIDFSTKGVFQRQDYHYTFDIRTFHPCSIMYVPVITYDSAAIQPDTLGSDALCYILDIIRINPEILVGFVYHDTSNIDAALKKQRTDYARDFLLQYGIEGERIQYIKPKNTGFDGEEGLHLRVLSFEYDPKKR